METEESDEKTILDFQQNRAGRMAERQPGKLENWLLGRGNMTPSYIRRVVGKGDATRWPSADCGDQQELVVEREAVSLQPSLIVQADMRQRREADLRP